MTRVFVPLLSRGRYSASQNCRPNTRSRRSIDDLHLRTVAFDLGLREQIGQLGFIAALSGFRSLVADVLFVQAHVAWEQTEWGRVLLLFRQVTTLQPRAILFWDMAAWHMAWNASTAAINDSTQPRLALRIKAQREYFQLGKDFLERGIKNNPDRPQLYEAMARLYRDKYQRPRTCGRVLCKGRRLAWCTELRETIRGL